MNLWEEEGLLEKSGKALCCMIPLGIYDDATNFKEIYAAMAKDEKESNNKSKK